MQHRLPNTSPSIMIAALLAIVLSFAGIVAIIGQIQAVNSTTGELVANGEEPDIASNIALFILGKLALAQKTELARHCANCGVVDSITMYEIKKNFNKTVTHRVKVRMDNGSYRVVSQQDQPAFHVGDKVKIINGVIVQLEKAKLTNNDGVFASTLGVLTNRFF